MPVLTSAAPAPSSVSVTAMSVSLVTRWTSARRVFMLGS